MVIEVKYRSEFLEILKQFISRKLDEAGSDGVVVGVSGGLDSAVVLKLCTEIVSPDKISALFLPENTTPPQDITDAHLIANECNVELLEIPINEILSHYLENTIIPKPQPLSLGNLKARIRMNIIFYIANSMNRLVMGTSNKSELLLGYFTKFGDGASDIAPIGDLYKTQVVKLAEHLKVPENIISKPPRAGLVADQTDEQDLGMDYVTIDKILFALERNIATQKIADELGHEKEKIEEIKTRVEQNRHKRKFPKIPKIGIKTIGVDLYE
jgi:NAD+ synthase